MVFTLLRIEYNPHYRFFGFGFFGFHSVFGLRYLLGLHYAEKIMFFDILFFHFSKDLL